MNTAQGIFSYLHTVNTQLAVSLLDGATLYTLTCCLGRFSGAHFNPAQTLSVIFVGRCRLAIGLFMIFMQFLGAFLGAVYAQCILQNNTFAVAMHAAIRWSSTDIHATNRLQYFFMELTLSTLVCCAYLFTGVISHGRNGALCAAIISTARAIVTFVGYSTIGQTSNLARTIGLISTAYIFLAVRDEWRFIYIPFLCCLLAGSEFGMGKEKSKMSMQLMKKEVELREHQIPIEELCAELKTNVNMGHSEEKANQLLKEYGLNMLTPPKKRSELVAALKCLFAGFNFLLWLGSLASVTSYIIENQQSANVKLDNLYMGIVLAVVVVVTGFFAYYQEYKSSKIMESFARLAPPTTTVLRDGQMKRVDATLVVPGDIVYIKAGDRIPADVRVITSSGLKVDCSTLTGESEPQNRSPECTHVNPLETNNLVLFGTGAVEGKCKGIVVLTGDRTIMGRIAYLTSRVDSGKTPIGREIDHFITIIGIVAATIGISFFIISIIYGYTFVEALVFLIGIIVANVPEGIIATMTVCLTLTAVKMRRKNCLVKKLEGVETLGSTSTICSDKTGTLTQNRMTVTHTWFNGSISDVNFHESTLENIDPKELNFDRFVGTFGAFLRCAALCSNATFKDENRDVKLWKRDASGDASEVAILKYCEYTCGNVTAYRKLYPKIFEIPFNSTNKFQVSIHKQESDGHFVLVMKGAPEQIIDRCKTCLEDNGERNLTREDLKLLQNAYEYLGGLGERVMGFCDLDLDPKKYRKNFAFCTNPLNFPLEGLRFLGLISMIDPPRPAVPHAVDLCQSAGIKIVMVTGDHPLTAEAIARQVNIIREGSITSRIINDGDKLKWEQIMGNGDKCQAMIVHGEQLKKLSDKDLNYIVKYYSCIVFARTSPIQKLQIVEAFQNAGHIVAVTGDGVNDAPALRKADIGIAMGIAGTDVSKEAADMILLDDNFASIVTGVEEGRIIFDNLKKSIAYTLTSNIPEITPFLSYILFGIPLPMSVVAILCIDLGTDLWPAISIAYEEAETNIMERPPRNARVDKLVNARLMNFSYLQIGIIQAAAGFMTYLIIMAENGFHIHRLLWIRDEWDDSMLDDLEDSYGQQWVVLSTYKARKDLERCCHGAFFYAIVVVQWADLLISKTRYNSIVQQGMSTQHVPSFHALRKQSIRIDAYQAFVGNDPSIICMVDICLRRST
uniref:Na(+)/K(+)-exchanging ATPase n=1 Tax=Wuchereria bancrofti TaxID=6293 RepID=A0A1I8EIX7_WUCBA